MIGCLRTDLDELASRETLQARARDLLSPEIAADESGIGLANVYKRLASLMMRDVSDVETPVLIALAQDRYVQHDLVYAFDDAGLETREGADVADAVPRIQIARRFALRFVAFQKTRHEELFG